MHYDIVTIGGGLAGATLAKVMAQRGARVLIIERELAFKDRVRGEAMIPWGADEARKLGIYDLLVRTCGHEQPWMDVFIGPNQIAHRNLIETTPQRVSAINFYHPRMQEALLAAAAEAGAHVRRGATVQGVNSGSEPSVTVDSNGKREEISARLIVGADGRVSLARKWGNFTVQRDDPHFTMAGVWLNDVRTPEDTGFLLTNPANGTGVFLFPQGNGKARAYTAYLASEGDRIQGRFEDFARQFASSGAPADFLAGAKPNGPVASFDAADTWTPLPYKNGLALIGDAAASSDPCWGQGLSLTLRDVRVLTDCLSSNDNWEQAGNDYAIEHDRYHDVIRTVTKWLREVLMQPGPQADAIRARALPLIASDITRVPDHVMSGPDLPFNENVRARFYGEA